MTSEKKTRALAATPACQPSPSDSRALLHLMQESMSNRPPTKKKKTSLPATETPPAQEEKAEGIPDPEEDFVLVGRNRECEEKASKELRNWPTSKKRNLVKEQYFQITQPGVESHKVLNQRARNKVLDKLDEDQNHEYKETLEGKANKHEVEHLLSREEQQQVLLAPKPKLLAAKNKLFKWIPDTECYEINLKGNSLVPVMKNFILGKILTLIDLERSNMPSTGPAKLCPMPHADLKVDMMLTDISKPGQKWYWLMCKAIGDMKTLAGIMKLGKLDAILKVAGALCGYERPMLCQACFSLCENNDSDAEWKTRHVDGLPESKKDYFIQLIIPLSLMEGCAPELFIQSKSDKNLMYQHKYTVGKAITMPQSCWHQTAKQSRGIYPGSGPRPKLEDMEDERKMPAHHRRAIQVPSADNNQQMRIVLFLIIGDESRPTDANELLIWKEQLLRQISSGFPFPIVADNREAEEIYKNFGVSKKDILQDRKRNIKVNTVIQEHEYREKIIATNKWNQVEQFLNDWPELHHKANFESHLEELRPK